ncbi:MAG: TolC family protein [Sphingobacteriales bacterium]|nr:TolC family protein [Sphingobacteriales bacterium]
MIRYTLALLLLCAPGFLQAQDSAYSLEASVLYALEHHASVKNALLEEQVAERKIDQLKGAGTPQLNFSGEINDFIDVPTSFVPGDFFGGAPGSYVPVQFGQQYSAAGGINFNQLLFEGSYIVGLQAAKNYRELSRKYYGALVADARLAIVEANITRVNKLLTETAALNKAGFTEKLDVDRLELAYNNLLVEREKVLSFKLLGYLLLKFHMGYPYDKEIVLTENLEEISTRKNTVPEKINTENRPEFQSLRASRDLQALDVKLQRYSYLPSLVAIGTFSYNNARTQFDFFDPSLRWYPTTLIGARLNVPIWTGLQKSAKVSQARLNLQKIDNSIELMRNTFALELAGASKNYQNILMSLEITRKNRELAKEISRVAKVKYESGIGSSLELVDAESSLREADANYFSTLYELLISRLEVEKASGAITID